VRVEGVTEFAQLLLHDSGSRYQLNTLIAFQRQAEPMLAALESGETGTISVANYERDNDSDESLQ